MGLVKTHLGVYRSVDNFHNEGNPYNTKSKGNHQTLSDHVKNIFLFLKKKD